MFLNSVSSLISKQMSNFGKLVSNTLLRTHPQPQLQQQQVAGYKSKVRYMYIPDPNGHLRHGGDRMNMYRPNAMKRLNEYGMKARLSTNGGQQILWRKILKGKTGWKKLPQEP